MHPERADRTARTRVLPDASRQATSPRSNTRQAPLMCPTRLPSSAHGEATRDVAGRTARPRQSLYGHSLIRVNGIYGRLLLPTRIDGGGQLFQLCPERTPPVKATIRDEGGRVARQREVVGRGPAEQRPQSPGRSRSHCPRRCSMASSLESGWRRRRFCRIRSSPTWNSSRVAWNAAASVEDGEGGMRFRTLWVSGGCDKSGGRVPTPAWALGRWL